MVKEMKRLKFTRIDADLRHIIVGRDQAFEVIDHVNAYTTVRSISKHMLRGIKRLGMLGSLLDQVSSYDSSLYREWAAAVCGDQAFHKNSARKRVLPTSQLTKFVVTCG